MKRKIEIELFEKIDNTLDINWEEKSFVTINYDKKMKHIKIEANKNGFISLAKIFLSIAENDSKDDFHLFLDAETRDKACGDLQYGSENVFVNKVKIEGK